MAARRGRPRGLPRPRPRWAAVHAVTAAGTVQKAGSDSAGLTETSQISIDTASAEGTLTETATIEIAVQDAFTASDLVLLLQAALAANDAAAIADAVTAIAVAANVQDQATEGENSSLDDGGVAPAGVISRHVGLPPNTAVITALARGALVTLTTRTATVTAKPRRAAAVTAKPIRAALVTAKPRRGATVTAKPVRGAVVTVNDRDAG